MGSAHAHVHVHVNMCMHMDARPPAVGTVGVEHMQCICSVHVHVHVHVHARLPAVGAVGVEPRERVSLVDGERLERLGERLGSGGHLSLIHI